MIAQHLIADPPPITNLRPVPPSVVARWSAHSPKPRLIDFASARAFSEALFDTLSPVAGPSPSRGWLARNRRVVVAVLVAGVAGVFVFTTTQLQRRTTQTPRVAVLPLRNLSPDSSDSHLAQALHENLVSRIGMIRGLAVTSRNSVLRYGGGRTSRRMIAQDLGVDFILEGSVRNDSGRINVSVQLIDAHTDTQLWSVLSDGPFGGESDRHPGGYRAAADRRASGANQCRRAWANQQSSYGEHRRIRALFSASQLPVASDLAANNASEELLKQALLLDPRFLEASAALAQVYGLRAYLLGGSRRWADSGLVLAQAAVKSDSMLFTGYGALGLLYLDLGHLKQARAAYAKLLDLRPSDGTGDAVPRLDGVPPGRLPEAVSFWADTRAVDPMNTTVAADMVLVELLFGDVERASRWNQVRSALPMRDMFGGVGDTRMLLWQGKTAEGVQRAERQLRTTRASRRAAWLRWLPYVPETSRARGSISKRSTDRRPTTGMTGHDSSNFVCLCIVRARRARTCARSARADASSCHALDR